LLFIIDLYSCFTNQNTEFEARDFNTTMTINKIYKLRDFLYPDMITLQNRFIPHILLLLLMVLASVDTFAQVSNDKNDPVYGFDPLLYNGRMYVFYQPETGGTQYLYNDFDSKGSIIIRGVTYTNVNINYDIYNQQLILKYKDALGSPRLIEISFAWLDSFILEGKPFEVIAEASSTKRIYQVLGSGNKKILYGYQKKLLLHNHESSGTFYFSKIIKEKYVMNGTHIAKFNNNHSFISAFSLLEQDLIKKYIRNKNINIKKANDHILADLINYCITLGGQ